MVVFFSFILAIAMWKKPSTTKKAVSRKRLALVASSLGCIGIMMR